MTKTFHTYLLQILLLTGIIVLALGTNYIFAASNTWTGPSALPPNSNATAPLNVGTTNQVKDANLSVGHAANTATDYGLIAYGKIRSTIGGVEFPDGTVQTTAASAGTGAPTVSYAYTTNGTWTKPAGLSALQIETWGAGQGGCGGATGGSSSMQGIPGTPVANGGTKNVGNGTGTGQVVLTAQGVVPFGGTYGTGGVGGSCTASGNAQGGGGGTYSCGSGWAGAYAKSIVSGANISAGNYNVIVGGAGGVTGGQCQVWGSQGTGGLVILTEYN